MASCCGDSTCMCGIEAGAGISVAGNGSASNPFVITNTDPGSGSGGGAISDLFFLPETYGAVGDGIADDTVPLQDAMDAAFAAGGGTVLLRGRYGWRGDLFHRGAIKVLGVARRKVLVTDDHMDRGLVALDSTARYRYGQWGGGSVNDNPGPVECLVIDGAGIGGSGTELFRMECVDGSIVDCNIVNSAGNGIEFGGSQNSSIERTLSGYHAGRAISIYIAGSQGAGQIKINNCYLTDSAYLFLSDTDSSQFPAHDITFNQCLFENHATGKNIGWLKAGDFRFNHCVFTNSNSGAVPQDAVVKVTQDIIPTFSTTAIFDTCWFNGGSNADKPAGAVWIKAATGGVGNIVRLLGQTQVTNCDAVFTVEGSTIANTLSIGEDPFRGGGVAMFSTVPGGSLFGTFKKTAHPTMWSIPDDASASLRNPILIRHDADTQNRGEIDRDFTHYWKDGANIAVRASLGYLSASNLMSMGGMWQAANAWVQRISSVLINSVGQAVTLDASAAGAPAYGLAYLLNNTSANLTVTGGQDGSMLTVIMYATSTTGNTVTWPSNVKFNTTAPQPKDLAAIVVELVQYGGNWYEMSRSRYGDSTTCTEYLTAQTNTAYTIPLGTKIIEAEILGSGGGGGAGRRGAAGTVRCGGGGASGGARSLRNFPVSDLPGGTTTLYVTVGAAGVGAAAQGADSTDGANGTAGGAAALRTSTSSTAATTILIANGGNFGSGGTAATGLGGGAQSNGIFASAAGAAASTTGLVGNPGNISLGAGAGGASGGGITTGDAQSAGGAGGYSAGGYTVASVAGTAGGGAGTAGADNAVVSPGQAGAGGGSNTGGAGGAGGNGAKGGGGGGGGASLNGNASGKGGDGGLGYVKITTWL